MRWFGLTILALCLSCIASCGGGGSGSDPAGAAVSGNWEISLQGSGSMVAEKMRERQLRAARLPAGGMRLPGAKADFDSPDVVADVNYLSGFLVEGTDGVVTGSALFSAKPCSGVGEVSGSVNETAVSLTVSPNGVTVNLTGLVGAGATTMNGSYTMLSSGCGGSQSNPQAGSWTANLVSPLMGNIQGTFVSTKSATTYPIAGKIAQGPNSGSSNAPLTGSLNITGSPCFTASTISGAISGTAVVIIFNGPNGTEIGQISGTSSLNGTALTGSYKIVPQNTPPGTPCHAGDAGSVNFKL